MTQGETPSNEDGRVLRAAGIIAAFCITAAAAVAVASTLILTWINVERYEDSPVCAATWAPSSGCRQLVPGTVTKPVKRVDDSYYITVKPNRAIGEAVLRFDRPPKVAVGSSVEMLRYGDKNIAVIVDMETTYVRGWDPKLLQLMVSVGLIAALIGGGLYATRTTRAFMMRHMIWTLIAAWVVVIIPVWLVVTAAFEAPGVFLQI